ncbi:MAG TPA: hypothetical protein VN787_05690 [Steroidobacteraceae bacterium]|nr:hypothetical protein [Steroidobacteraceae bacterium]
MAVPTVASRTPFSASIEAGRAGSRRTGDASQPPPVCDGTRRGL